MLQKVAMAAGAARRIVRKDFNVVIGGPRGATNVVASFKKGDVVLVQRVGKKRDYPKMYRISGTPEGRIFSRAVLAQFLGGFEPRRRAHKPGSS